MGAAPPSVLRSDFLPLFQEIVDQLALQGAAVAAAKLKRTAGIKRAIALGEVHDLPKTGNEFLFFQRLQRMDKGRPEHILGDGIARIKGRIEIGLKNAGDILLAHFLEFAHR